MTFNEQVYALVRRIPYGKVLNYGAVAALLGNQRGARAVGWALGSLPRGSDVPWWRVINASGRVSIRSDQRSHDEQRRLLEAEGVRFNEQERVNMMPQGGVFWQLSDLEILEIRNSLQTDT